MSEHAHLVDAQWLVEHARDPRVRIVDTRWYLGGARRGKGEYAAGHIPGAAFVDLDRELAGNPQKGPGRHPLPSAGDFANTLSRLGVVQDSLVIAYDDVGGAIAARLWWLLRYFGHRGGRVLDGGVGQWTALGQPLCSEPCEAAPAAPLALSPGSAGVVDKEAVLALLRDRAGVVLDARAPERYQGLVEPVDARAGHVPGARSAPFAQNLQAPGGRFLDAATLRSRYAALGALEGPVACYCGSGVTACHDLLALALIGKEDALLYEGSWSDWAADESLPLSVGPDAG